jgi:hypothetical protein
MAARKGNLRRPGSSQEPEPTSAQQPQVAASTTPEALRSAAAVGIDRDGGLGRPGEESALKMGDAPSRGTAGEQAQQTGGGTSTGGPDVRANDIRTSGPVSPQVELDVFWHQAEATLAARRGAFDTDLAASAGDGKEVGAPRTLEERQGTIDDVRGGADKGQEAANQAVSDLMSEDPLLGRSPGGSAMTEVEIGMGLIGDQDTAASSPLNVAFDSAPWNPIATLVNVAADINQDIQTQKIFEEGVEAQRAAKGGNKGGETTGAGTAPVQVVFDDAEGVKGQGNVSEAELRASHPTLAKVADFMIAPTVNGTPSPRAEALTQAIEELDKLGAGSDSSGSSGSATGGGASQPVDPDEPGGPPTAAQMAFRQSLLQQSGRTFGPGNVDPADDSQPIDGGSAVGMPVQPSMGSLVGQPGSDRGFLGGATGGSFGRGPLPSGTDIDPLDGHAFTGGALGGNPEDVDFGGNTIPGGFLGSSSSTDSDEEDDSDDGE